MTSHPVISVKESWKLTAACYRSPNPMRNVCQIIDVTKTNTNKTVVFLINMNYFPVLLSPSSKKLSIYNFNVMLSDFVLISTMENKFVLNIDYLKIHTV